MCFDIVLAVDRRWGLGKNNGLPWPKLRGDMAHFKRITMAASAGRKNAIVMGRKTWDSMGGKALPGRKSVVVTRQPLKLVDAVVAETFDTALDAAADAESTFVIGGAEIFRLAIAHPALRRVYLTRIDGDYACDVVIEPIVMTADPTWPPIEGEDNGVCYRIERLVH